MGKLFLASWLDLWKMRNEERHGQDREQQEAFRKSTIKAELEELYKLKPAVCPVDRHIFHANVEEHLQQHSNLSRIEEWIHLYREPIRSSAQQAKQLGIQQNRRILDYPMFNPATIRLAHWPGE